MRFLAISLSLIAAVVALIWLISSPGYDSIFALAAALAALISSLVFTRRSGSTTQTQHVSGSSIGIQAGGNVQTNNIKKK